jgi:CheY-like chemotaxis protein
MEFPVDKARNFRRKEPVMKTILVVDDEECIRDVLSIALTAKLSECTIRTAENGAKAAQIFDSSRVNVIVTDLSMPIMDGYQLMEHVRRKSSSLPVFAMTGHAGRDVELRLKTFGVARCFQKPFDLYDFVNEIASVLGMTESRSNLKSSAPAIVDDIYLASFAH